MDDDVRPQPTEIVEQVEGEAVVVVDEHYHVESGLSLRCLAVAMARRRAIFPTGAYKEQGF